VCPLCLTSLAITVATTTGTGAAVTAFAVRVRRSLTRKNRSEIRLKAAREEGRAQKP
jgi:hypothetical protein